MTHTDPIKALVEHMERHIEQYYGTEHTPIFNWTEWEIILAALKPASPAPVDGERVRAAKIEAFDEALSIAEGSYSYGEQQNEIIAGIRAALAAIGER